MIQKKKYNVEGMHCGACATGIEMYLSNTEGVKSARVNYGTKKAEIEFDDAVINDDGISKTVSELGYKINPE